MRRGKVATWVIVVVGLVVLLCGSCGVFAWQAGSMGMKFAGQIQEAMPMAQSAVQKYTESFDALALYAELHPEVRRTTKPDPERAKADQALLGKVTSVGAAILESTNADSENGKTVVKFSFKVPVTAEKGTRQATVVIRSQDDRLGVESVKF